MADIFKITIQGSINKDMISDGDLLFLNQPNSASSVGNINYMQPGFIPLGVIKTPPLPAPQPNHNELFFESVGGLLSLENGLTLMEIDDISSMFVLTTKDSRVNTSGIKGYYAEVKFVNNSSEKAELFAIGSQIQPSSK